ASCSIEQQFHAAQAGVAQLVLGLASDQRDEDVAGEWAGPGGGILRPDTAGADAQPLECCLRLGVARRLPLHRVAVAEVVLRVEQRGQVSLFAHFGMIDRHQSSPYATSLAIFALAAVIVPPQMSWPAIVPLQ